MYASVPITAPGCDHRPSRLPQRAMRTRRQGRRRRRLQHLGQAPVHHLHLAERPHHDVRRLQVAVDDARAVGVGHRLADLLEHFQEPRQVLGRGLALCEAVGQGAALDQLHGEVRPAVGEPAQVVDRHDAGVLQLAADLRFFDEALLQFRTGHVFIPQHLEGEVAAQKRVMAAQHQTHASPTDLGVEAIADGRRLGQQRAGGGYGRPQRIRRGVAGLGRQGTVNGRGRHGTTPVQMMGRHDSSHRGEQGIPLSFTLQPLDCDTAA